MSAANALLSPRNRALLLVSFVIFFLLGAMQALYGPAFPLFRARFDIDVEQVSMVVSAQFFAAFLAIAVSGVLVRRFAYRPVLVAGAVACLVGMLGIALAPAWWLVLVGAFVAGTGFGLLNVTCNLMVAIAFRPNAAPALNLLNAVFGIGAVLGPLMVAASEPRIAVPFLVLAGVSLFTLGGVLALRPPAVTVVSQGAAPTRWGLVAGFVFLYFFYVASESGVAAWETEYLTPAFGAVAAAGFPALFWGAVTVGRLLATPLSAVVSPRNMVLGASALGFLFMLLAHSVSGAPYLYAAVGLCFAPIFGTSLAWLTQVFPERAEQVTPIVVASANLGPVITAPLIGAAVAAGGTGVIPTALAALSLLLVLVVSGLWWRTRGPA